MVSNIVSYSILLLYLLPCASWSQGNDVDLSLEQSLDLLHKENKSLKIAGKEVEWARNEHQKLNAFWYPSVNAAGAFVHMSNPIEVRQSLSKYTEPAKEFVHNYIPDNELIMSVLDKIGQGTFSLPLISQNITSIDATVTWPVFTGGKRIYANKIGKTMVSIAEVNRNQVDANQQSLLIEAYFGLRLGQSVVDVKTEVYNSLKTHYDQALKLEQNGMINRAERLFAQVSMDEAKRELESARKDLTVAQQAFKSLINMEEGSDVRTTTPLFINEALPPAQYFKDLVPMNNYIVNQLKLQQVVADNQLKIGRSAYVPNIALFGKQTLYADGLDKYLLPRTMVGVGFTWNIFDGLNREDTLVVINSPEALAKYQQVNAMENIAKYQHQKVDEGTRKQIIASLQQLWNKSKSDLQLAKITYDRVNALYKDSVVTSQRKDEVEAMYKAAEAAERAAYSQYQMAVDGAQIQDKESARSLVTAAQGTVEEVAALLQDARLTAPESGQISAIFPKRGELVGAGMPIMNLVVLDDVHVVLNVREDRLPLFKMGGTFVADVPAIDKKDIEFKINYISPLGSFATWKSTKQTGSYDLRTFEIHALPVEKVEGLRPGMSVLYQLP